ncbi:MAG: ABC transporter permease, partial [Pseudomonadota bacterium]
MINSIKEETEQLLHNRMLIIVLFIIPIAANLLIGWVFQSSVIRHIPMAIVDYDRSSLSRTIIQNFSESDTFSVEYMLQDEDTLKRLLEEEKVKVGMVIPGNFSQDVTMLRSPNVLMIYDGSSMPVASTAKSKASEILMTLKTGAAMKLIGGKLSLPPDVAKKTALTIIFKNRFIYNPAKSYAYTLNPVLGAAAVQSAIVLMGAVCIRKEKLSEGLKKNLGYIAGKVAFYGILGTASLMCSVFIQHVIFAVPLKSSALSVMVLCLFMAVAEAACAVMISVWV